ncbi:ureidoglycolate lyase [Lederbergia sp. NSJ-179]|uniref:ureidoglycolate lyase n=1 Tax=Lederbergia sp. NSJ-179 TaxID=2931402 RepID=UPI001FD222D5|nr:ureidoglycolate lyase [Lederbergia sp. NSJ-179]MCJ7842974.1 ureidoglycolate lyase [Lederbergia sp. NSJ-179]
MKKKIDFLTHENFEPYGKIVEVPESAPTKIGEGWECWNYVQMMDVDTEVGMGLVNTKQRPFEIESMERHDSREELLIALKGDIIQPIALSEDIENPNEKPDPDKVKCFLLKQGQGIILKKGIWHSPAYPATEDTFYLFIIERKPDKYGDEILNPWVEFENNAKVKFEF